MRERDIIKCFPELPAFLLGFSTNSCDFKKDEIVGSYFFIQLIFFWASARPLALTPSAYSL